ncbi:MAG TPA: tetratricopeptide repeat protein [Verrucomicrobiae bacterium]|jgi:TPR repeat protein
MLNNPAGGPSLIPAETHDAETQFALGFTCAGVGTPQYTQALEWYQKAADQDHRLAQFNLGQMFAEGQGVPQCDSTAVMWIRRAANGGDVGAQFNLGERCTRACTQGSEREAAESRIEAYKWFKLAAVELYRDAQDRTDLATVRMSREEVVEGNRRVKDFVVS